MKERALRGFYAILDVKEAPGGSLAPLRARAEALLAGGPCCLQLRAKSWPAAPLYELGRLLVPVCHSAAVPFCMNDRVDLALAVGADAVHVGQDDLPLAETRRLVGAMTIGVSTHNPAQAEAAVRGGADYIGFGPVFATQSKLNPDPVVGLEALGAVCATVDVPVVAIGGITRATVPAVARAGAAAAALIAEVERAADPGAVAREIAAAFARTG